MVHQIKEYNKCTLIVLLKDVTLYEVERFKEALAESNKDKGPNKRIIIDFAGIGYIDALALGALVAFSKEIRERGGDVKLINMNDDIRAIFDLTRLSRIYEIHNDIEAAANSFTSQ